MNAIIEMLTHEANPECLHDGKSLEWKNPYLELTDPDWAEERRPVRLLAKLPADTPRTYFTHLGYDALPETMKKNAKVQRDNTFSFEKHSEDRQTTLCQVACVACTCILEATDMQ